MTCPRLSTSLISGVLAFASVNASGQAPTPDKGEAAFRALYKQLVEINTTLSSGSCTKAAEAMAKHLRDAGFAASDLKILTPKDRPNDGNLIATLPGKDRSALPILLLAHLDVVEAKREDWERDPFTLIEEGGFFYARGSSDDKAMAAVFVDSLARYKAEGFVPQHDLKMALTCGEETPDTFNGVDWLIKNHPDALKAAYALNEGAGGELDKDDKPIALQVQAGEKIYQDFTLESTNSGGHSSRPIKENAIYHLAAGISKIGAYQFPIALNPVTRSYFSTQAELSPASIANDMRAVLASPSDQAAADRLWDVNPGWNSMMRTTCVTTMINAGHAPNALPQRARANVNCRILPGSSVEATLDTLKTVVSDDKVAVTLAAEPSAKSIPPTLTPQILDPIKVVAEEIWPGVAIVPTMSTGATDGRFLNASGVPTYGMSGMFHDAEGSRAHGLNERIRVKSLLDGRRFLYEVVKRYASGTNR
ncbi:MAG: M20/M25/M40 family metallo-hydrolase [Dokdonella sp.]